MVRLKENKVHGQVEVLLKENKEIKSLGFLLGLWLLSIYLFPLASRMYFNGAGLQMSYVLAVIWPEIVFFFVLKNMLPTKVEASDMVAMFFFFAAILVSSIVSIDKIDSTIFFILTIFVFVIVYQYKSYLTTSQYIFAFKVYSLAALLVSIIFALHDYRPGVRLGNGTDIMNPNAISMILMSVAVTAMAFNRLILKVLIAGVAIYLLYLTDSRTSMVSMFIAVSTYVFFSVTSSSKSKKYIFFILLMSLLGVAVAYSDQSWKVLNGILKVDDEYRGIDSGASGRMEIWGVVWTMIMDNIITGIGYRSHEKVLGISAHNGYLATFLEIGLIGFLSIMYLVIKGVLIIRAGMKNSAYNKTNIVMFSFCLGYMFLAMFERYLINIGNPASLIFLLIIIMPRATVNRYA